MINVTRSNLPSLEEYNSYLKQIWESRWLTNRGSFVKQLEDGICKKLNIEHVLFVSNGTIALQLAIKILELKGDIITTPFSYVATTNSIIWENCNPIFCDINDQDFCIDANKIEALVTPNTTAILATHVYGIPCNVEKIEKIAKKHNLKVIYDGAHSFGVKLNNKSIFEYGDISTCSFHATKVFHTIEGGSITCNIPELRDGLFKYHAFGHIADDYYSVGINGKNSEFHAAMGLCNLKVIDQLIEQRRKVFEAYNKLLQNTNLSRPTIPKNIEYNYSYYPIVFETEEKLLLTKETLYRQQINTRRYFYPSLNNLPYIKNAQPCPISEDIAKRVLCLPLYPELDIATLERITETINTAVEYV